MGLLSLIGLTENLDKPIRAISDLYTTDKSRIMANAAYQSIDQQRGLLQLSTNKIMASSANFFTEAWQPAIGWTAGFCMALYYIPQLIIVNVVWADQVLNSNVITQFPIDPADLLHLVYLLFGFGTYNIVKKIIN